MSERNTALINTPIKLKAEFRLASGDLYDPDSFIKVEIFAEDNTTLLEEILPAQIIKEATGVYFVITDVVWNIYPRNIFDKWTFKANAGDPDRYQRTNCYIDDVVIAKEDFRKGFAYENPDLKRYKDWGAIITPDELRYIYAFGNQLYSGVTGETIPDSVLWWYIDNAIASVEMDLNYRIIKKRIFSHASATFLRDDVTDFDEDNDLWEEPYDFDWYQFKKYMYVKLRHFPINKVLKVQFADPLGHKMYEFSQWAKPNKFSDGSIEFFPNVVILAKIPFFASYHAFAALMQNNMYPDAWFIDYEVGFENVKQFRSRHKELVNVIGKISAMNLLDDYGDGRTSALASSSVGLSGISESFSTTMSATSAMFGARLESYRKELKDWYKKNEHKYGNGRTLFTVA